MERVVILGGGFAGVTAAKELQDDRDVTLVAPSPDFVFVPLLHEVASDLTAPEDVARPLADILPRTRIVVDRATRVEKGEVHTAGGSRLPFDACVVGVGAEPNDFGVPGVAEHALTFQSLPDAIRANAAVKRAAGAGRARIVVVGASFTGVEVAGEIHALGERLGARIEIALLDALPTIFPRQSEEFQRRILGAIEERGMTLRTSVKIVAVTPRGVVAQGEGEIPADVTFWCAGVKPRALPGVDPRVRPTLQSIARDDVFVVGDAALFPREMGVPALAQTAQDEARVAAWNILYPERMVLYEPNVRGLIVSVGHHFAVAELKGGLVLSGNLTWHLKRQLYKAKIALA